MSTTSVQAFAAICQIQNTPGKNDKTRLVGQFLEEGGEFASKLLQYTYNPFMTYGVRALPVTQPSSDHVGRPFSDATWALMDKLITRQLTGHAARDAIAAEMRELDADSQQLLSMVILKDLRAGFSESTVNKVRPGLIPEFPYCRCSLPKHTVLSEWDWDGGVYSQEKADGTFVNINLDVANVLLTTRAGNALPVEGFAAIIEELEQRFARGKQMHGEILVMKNGKPMPRKTGNGMITSVIGGGVWGEGCYPILKVWDAIELSAVVKKGRDETPYRERLGWIEQQMKASVRINALVTLIDSRIVHSLKEAFEHYREILAAGGEGTIVKKMSLVWFDGTSKEQIKLKITAPCEVRVTGFTVGKGKNAKTFGSLMCESADGLMKVRVGTGLTDAMRKAINANREDWMSAIITMEFNDIMYSDDLAKKTHSLFLPVFVERRLDKSEADDFPRIVEQFQEALRTVGLAEAA